MKAWSPNHWPTRESPHLSLKTESSRDPSSLEGRPGQLVTLLLVQPGPARNCGPPAEEEVGPRAFKSAPSTDPTPGFTQSRSTFPCWGVGTLLSIGPPHPTPPPSARQEEVQHHPPSCQGQQVPRPWDLEQGRGGSALLLGKDSASSSCLQSGQKLASPPAPMGDRTVIFKTAPGWLQVGSPPPSFPSTQETCPWANSYPGSYLAHPSIPGLQEPTQALTPSVNRKNGLEGSYQGLREQGLAAVSPHMSRRQNTSLTAPGRGASLGPPPLLWPKPRPHGRGIGSWTPHTSVWHPGNMASWAGGWRAEALPCEPG